jgi:hypothetical protein
MKNIRKDNQRRIIARIARIARLRLEVFVQHSVHDVQLPVPGQYLPQGSARNHPAKDWPNVLYIKGRGPY